MFNCNKVERGSHSSSIFHILHFFSTFIIIYSFPDSHVRTKAIHWIRHLTNDELCDYLPQLVQVSAHIYIFANSQ